MLVLILEFLSSQIKDELMMRPPEYNLAQSFDSQIEGWILSRSVRPFVKKKIQHTHDHHAASAASPSQGSKDLTLLHSV